MRCPLACLALLIAPVAAGSPAPAQEAKPAASPVLRWKVPAGTKLHYCLTADRKTKVGPEAPEVTSVRKTFVTIEALESLPGGATRFRETVDRLVTEQGQPARSFDSARDPVPAGMNLIVGRVFTFSMDPLGKVSDVTLEGKPPEIDPQMAEALAALNRPAAFENLIPTMPLPEEAATPATTWKSAKSLEGSPVGTTRAETTHRYLGTTRAGGATIARIGLEAVYTHSGELDPALPLAIKSMTGGGRGEARFDVGAGVLIDSRVDEESEMVIEARGRRVTMTSKGVQRWERIDAAAAAH
jgi:hypothetical protein